MTNFDKFLMQGLLKYYKKKIIIVVLIEEFFKYFKNIFGIFPQKQSQKGSKSKQMWFMLSHLHPY
jgi:hypothetical protein